MSGLLETFYFLFTSDAKQLDKGLDDSEKTNAKLEKSLLATDATASKLGANLVSIVKSASAVAAGLMAYGAIKALVTEQAHLTDETAKGALAARMSTENFTAYTQAVLNAGGSSGAFAATLEKLGERGRDPIKMLEQLRSRFQGLSQAQALRLGKMMGLDVGTIELLTKTKKELSEIIEHQKKLGSVTKEQAMTARAFNNQMRDMGTVFDDIKRRIAMNIAPAFTAFFKIIETALIWMRDHKEFMGAFFATIAGVITATYIPAVTRAVVATYLLIAPYLLIGAAIAAVGVAIALVYDDMKAFMAGNDSIIGELVKKWPIVGDVIQFIGDMVNGFIYGIVQASQNMANVFLHPIDSLKELGKAWDILVNSFLQGFDKVAEIISKIKNFFGASSSINVVGQGATAALNGAVQNGNAQLAAASSNPMAAVTSNAISNSSSVKNSKQVIVQAPVTIEATNKDPQELNDVLSKHLAEALKSAVDHHDDGFAA